MLRLAVVALACLLLVPSVAADHTQHWPRCDQPGAIDKAQCDVNQTVDFYEALIPHYIQDACIILFGEPC